MRALQAKISRNPMSDAGEIIISTKELRTLILGLGLASLSGDHPGYMPPGLKTNRFVQSQAQKQMTRVAWGRGLENLMIMPPTLAQNKCVDQMMPMNLNYLLCTKKCSGI